MKEETIEEVAERLFNNFQKENPIIPKEDIRPFKLGFIKGIKWKQDRMEEDLREAFRQGQDNMDYSDIFGLESKLTEQEWFEQYKKK
jgi:hypothetical protein